MDSSLSLTCFSKTYNAQGTDPFSIPGRVLLRYVWAVEGRMHQHTDDEGNTVNRYNDGSSNFPMEFRDGSVSGDVLLKLPFTLTRYVNRSARIGLGSGGVLFPNGLWADLNVDHPTGSTTYFPYSAITLLYEDGRSLL